MTYEAKAVKVMIASPSDVAKERQIIREVISRWNDINAEHTKTVLMAIGWETHSRPEMGDRPQAIINKQILKGCDILIAVFWTKIGTPTGEAVSGTAEEIQEHIAAGKPAMIYFSEVPVKANSIDQAQYDGLIKFKEYCRQMGLYHSYELLADFKDKLFDHVSHTMIAEYGSVAGGSVLPTQSDIPSLSEEARTLLMEASQDKQGTIFRVRTLDGLAIETNGQNFTENADARTTAKWESSITALERDGFIVDTGNSEIFTVTDKGFAIAERLV